MRSGITWKPLAGKRPSRLLVLLAVTVIYLLLLLIPFRQSYSENDNLGILYDLQYGHTVSFMSVLLGKVLSFLYLNISDAVPWYGLMLYAISGAALFLALVSVDTLCRDRWLKYSTFALMLVFFSRFIVTVSYNAASISIGFSCLLALMVYLRSNARPRFHMVLGLGFLFSFSYLIRTMGLKAVLLFSAVAVVFEVATRTRKSIRHFALFLLPLALLYSADAVIREYGVSEEYRSYKEWNIVRGKFHDFPVSHLNADNLEIQRINDWRYIDYRMLLNWAFFDERKFNIQTMKNVFRYSVPLPNDNGIMFGAIAGNCLGILRDYWRFWIVLTALAVFSISRRKRFLLSLQVAQGMLLLGGGALMATYMRFPERIADALFFGVMLLSFFLTFRDELGREGTSDPGETLPTGRHILTISLVLLGAAIVELPVTAAKTARRSEQQVQYYKCVATLRALDPDFLLLQAGSALGAQFQDPLRVHRDRLPAVPGGWRIFSPRFYEFLREHDLKHGQEVIPRLVGGGRTYIVCSRRFIRLLDRYVRLTYRCRTKVVLISELSGRTNIYQIKRLKRGDKSHVWEIRKTRRKYGRNER